MNKTNRRQYKCLYASPLGGILLVGTEDTLGQVCFDGDNLFSNLIAEEKNDLSIFARTKRWLDDYFAGKVPGELPPISLQGTAFQKEVWDILLTIPYGKTMSYGEIAAVLAKRRGIPRMSAQAVGGAVGKNPVGILVPCHRVIGTDGSLTGYAGGLDKKEYLLKLEGILS